jgi:hypothetical protein
MLPVNEINIKSLVRIEDVLIGDRLAFSNLASYFTEETSFIRLEYKALLEFMCISPLCYKKIEHALGN